MHELPEQIKELIIDYSDELTVFQWMSHLEMREKSMQANVKGIETAGTWQQGNNICYLCTVSERILSQVSSQKNISFKAVLSKNEN